VSLHLGQNYNLLTANKSENVAWFKYFGKTVTDQNSIPEEMLATVLFRVSYLTISSLQT
jgi:hypothetical protein